MVALLIVLTLKFNGSESRTSFDIGFSEIRFFFQFNDERGWTLVTALQRAPGS
jgi:hypothetical protein